MAVANTSANLIASLAGLRTGRAVSAPSRGRTTTSRSMPSTPIGSGRATGPGQAIGRPVIGTRPGVGPGLPFRPGEPIPGIKKIAGGDNQVANAATLPETPTSPQPQTVDDGQTKERQRRGYERRSGESLGLGAKQNFMGFGNRDLLRGGRRQGFGPEVLADQMALRRRGRRQLPPGMMGIA